MHVFTFHHACTPPPPHTHTHSLHVSFVFLALVRGRTQHLREVSHKLLCRYRYATTVLDMFVCSEVRKWARSRGMQAKTPILLALFATCPAKHTRNVSQIIDKVLSKPSREDWASKRVSGVARARSTRLSKRSHGCRNTKCICCHGNARLPSRVSKSATLDTSLA